MLKISNMEEVRREEKKIATASFSVPVGGKRGSFVVVEVYGCTEYGRARGYLEILPDSPDGDWAVVIQVTYDRDPVGGEMIRLKDGWFDPAYAGVEDDFYSTKKNLPEKIALAEKFRRR